MLVHFLVALYTPTPSRRRMAVTRWDYGGVVCGVFVGSRRRTLDPLSPPSPSSRITIILCNPPGHKSTFTDSQSKPRAQHLWAPPVGSSSVQDSAGAIRVNEYTPAHAEQGSSIRPIL